MTESLMILSDGTDACSGAGHHYWVNWGFTNAQFILVAQRVVGSPSSEIFPRQAGRAAAAPSRPLGAGLRARSSGGCCSLRHSVKPTSCHVGNYWRSSLSLQDVLCAGLG